jgi:hypothetical protein
MTSRQRRLARVRVLQVRRRVVAVAKALLRVARQHGEASSIPNLKTVAVYVFPVSRSPSC